jgi:hypothetical protein
MTKRFIDKKSDAKTTTMLKVPNTEAGREFLANLKHYTVAGTHIRMRARGPRAELAEQERGRRRGYDQDLPRKHAKHFAVYLDKTEFSFRSNAELRYAATHRHACDYCAHCQGIYARPLPRPNDAALGEALACACL